MIVPMSFTMERFRAVLREEREARIGGRDRLADKVGVAKSTIQNAEIGPDVPGIDTVARLIEAMPGLTLEEFFAKIERGQRSSDTSSTGAPLARVGRDDALSEANPSDADTVIRTLAQLLIREQEKAATARHRQDAAARAVEAERPPPSGKRPRRSPRRKVARRRAARRRDE